MLRTHLYSIFVSGGESSLHRVRDHHVRLDGYVLFFFTLVTLKLLLGDV